MPLLDRAQIFTRVSEGRFPWSSYTIVTHSRGGLVTSHQNNGTKEP
jgi:hypothetical protein